MVETRFGQYRPQPAARAGIRYQTLHAGPADHFMFVKPV